MDDFYHNNQKIEDFFSTAHKQYISLSYEDIRLMPQYSDVHPTQITLDTMLTRNIALKNPIISAAMDTVTEAKAAITMAKCGGIGIIHKNFDSDPEQDLSMQIKEVNKVKHHLHGLIKDPISVSQEITLETLLQYKTEKDFKFDTFIVHNNEGALAGLVTHAIIKYNRHKPEQKIKDIMIRDVITRSHCTIEEAYQLMLQNHIGVVVLTNNNHNVTGMYTFSDVENIICNANPQYTVDDDGRLRVGAAVGGQDMQRVEALIQAGVDVIVLDSAHGDSYFIIKALKEYKHYFPNLDIIAGNISTGEAAKHLIDAGADAIKVGQGPGQICSTRIISGIGVMQADAVNRVATVASPHKIPVIADGGIRYSGDIPIAIACGASTVMLGQLLAGCDESPGISFHENGKVYKIYRGMASLEAMTLKKGSDRYLKAASELKKLAPEGITKKIAYKGSLHDQVFMISEGIKAGFGYCGAKNIPSFRQQAELLRIMPGGINESHPDVTGMIHSPPNYLK